MLQYENHACNARRQETKHSRKTDQHLRQGSSFHLQPLPSSSSPPLLKHSFPAPLTSVPMSTATSPDPQTAAATLSPASASVPIGASTTTPAAGTEAIKPTSEAVTGLTPEQVLQELKKSGYVDQLRRQMFDAFVAAGKPTAPTPAASSSASTEPTSGLANGAPADAQVSSTASATPVTPITTADATMTDVPSASAAPPSNQPTAQVSTQIAPNPSFDVSSKPAFLSSLSTPLRQQVEKEHDQLRFLDPRGQQDRLLKLLEFEPINHPLRETLAMRHCMTS